MAKHAGGRPPRWSSPEAMQKVIDKYFEDCEGSVLEVDGKMIFNKYGEPVFINRRPPTVTGLALALGFNSRQSLLNYKGKREFMDTISRAMANIEKYAEERLYDKDGQRGAEFTLKYNFRWKEPKADEDGGDQEKQGGVVIIPEVGNV